MWLCGVLDIPPHFPIDSIILRGLKHKAKWTNLDIHSYKIIIKLAKKQATETGYKNIAEWEAEKYFEMRNGK